MEDLYAALGLSDRFTKAELDAKWKAALGKYRETVLACQMLSDVEEWEAFPGEYMDYSCYFQALGLNGTEANIKETIRNQFAAANDSLSKSRVAYEILSDPTKRIEYDGLRKGGRYRLDQNLEDLKRNLSITVSSMNELLTMFREMQALDYYGFNVDELKCVNTHVEAINAAFKGIEPNVAFLMGVFASLKKKPAEQSSSSSRLCGDFRNMSI